MWQYVKHFFVEIIDNLLNQNNSTIYAESTKQRINRCSKTIFLYQVLNMKYECVSESFKGTFPAGYNEILEYLVKQCIKH
jgi:hypothetical protein